MTHIKKLVLQGFKSFAKKTEIPFDKGINTILGPNGAGKSNISDALCFVLGRLSIKSIRASKAKNLLFMGTKESKPSKEAFVELFFDNSNKTFNIDSNEIILKRIVRSNGQSIYKINNETKTRSDIIETLAQAGIDPQGFNLILQGQIQSVVKMHPDERRKIIEEVSGISIYETRKEKSLKELEKTELRLKDITTILRERTAFLRNLEKERAEALKFKELEKTIERCKFSILQKKINEKEKELKNIRSSIESKTNQKEKLKSNLNTSQEKIDSLSEKITKINTHIKNSTGIEKETLQETIINLRAKIEGAKVKKENYENRRQEIINRVSQVKNSIPEYKKEIEDLRKRHPLVAKKQEELKRKKEELQLLEEDKKKAYSVRTEINSLKERIKEKEISQAKANSEADMILSQIEECSSDFKHNSKEECENGIKEIKSILEELKKSLTSLSENESQTNGKVLLFKSEIVSSEKIRNKISEIDTCPLCQNKMTDKHVNHVIEDSDSKIKSSKEKISILEKNIKKIISEKQLKQKEIEKTSNKIFYLEKELSSHLIVNEKKSNLRRLLDQVKNKDNELRLLIEKKSSLEKKYLNLSSIEEQYNSKLREIEEISSRAEEDLDKTLYFKERELEKSLEIIKFAERDLEEVSTEIEEISLSVSEKSLILQKKEKEEQKMNEKFKSLLSDRDSLQEEVNEANYNTYEIRNSITQLDEQTNTLKIANAQIDASREALQIELSELPKNLETLNLSITYLEEKMQKTRDSIQKIGAINMRALEVYEGIKEEYDKVFEKVQTMEKEKEEILKIIKEIDNKKKKTFMRTFKGINEVFSTNFSRLSPKGKATLKIENSEDIFSGGIGIEIKLAKGKYFDVTSLSGGEQTLIALSLLFAIQEYKPYHFYIFDEIDAALDKRNSERLAALLSKHMKNGQYIVVTHNDAIISNSSFLYGVSMHDGISKVVSLKV